MNESGIVLKKIYEKEGREVVLIVHDELDLSIGSFKLSRNKGDGGHNGITSINQALSDQEILRLRIGISPVDTEGNIRRVNSAEQADFVLKPFSQGEKEKVESLSGTIHELLKVLILEGADKAMTLYNK
jgi:PTH1 family peptidyl-tRNA hydrolase